MMTYLRFIIKKIFSFIIYFLLLLYSIIYNLLKIYNHKSSDVDIAIVFFAGLGDFIVLCGYISQIYKSGKISLICPKSNGVFELASELGYFEKIYPMENNFKSRLKNINTLRNISANEVFTAPPQRHILTDIYNLSVNAERHFAAGTCMGSASTLLKKIADKHMDKIIPVNEKNEIDRYYQYISGMELVDVKPQGLKFDNRFIKDIKSNFFTKPTVAIFPGATGSSAKCWELSNYIWIIDKLSKKYDMHFVVMGTKQEREYADTICKTITPTVDISNICGETTILESINIIRECELVLANDSGSAHLSIASNISTIIIAGLWEYERFYPNPYLSTIHKVEIADRHDFACANCNKSKPTCVSIGTAPCVTAVKKEKVLNDVDKILEEKISEYIK